MEDISLVTVVFMLPLVGVFALLFVRNLTDYTVRGLTLIVSLITFGASLLLLRNFDTSVAGLQMVHQWDWIDTGSVTIRYYVGVDGISIWMVLLTTFIMPLAILTCCMSLVACAMSSPVFIVSK